MRKPVAQIAIAGQQICGSDMLLAVRNSRLFSAAFRPPDITVIAMLLGQRRVKAPICDMPAKAVVLGKTPAMAGRIIAGSLVCDIGASVRSGPLCRRHIPCKRLAHVGYNLRSGQGGLLRIQTRA